MNIHTVGNVCFLDHFHYRLGGNGFQVSKSMFLVSWGLFLLNAMFSESYSWGHYQHFYVGDCFIFFPILPVLFLFHLRWTSSLGSEHQDFSSVVFLIKPVPAARSSAREVPVMSSVVWPIDTLFVHWCSLTVFRSVHHFLSPTEEAADGAGTVGGWCLWIVPSVSVVSRQDKFSHLRPLVCRHFTEQMFDI